MDTEDKLKIFKKEICRNCKNDNCDKGIVVTKYENELLIKCCSYISKGKNKINETEIEVIRYYHDKNERKR